MCIRDSPSLDRLAQVVSIGHVKQEHVSTDPVHPWVLSAQPIEDHAELDLMHDIIRPSMVRDLKLRSLRQDAAAYQREILSSMLETYQLNGLWNMYGYSGLTTASGLAFIACVKKFLATP